jgi:CTP:molybdopterin cytidylyltransferase MocA
VLDVFRTGGARIVRPAYIQGGRSVPGHPVILARSIWPDVDELRSDQGARALWAVHPEWLREVPVAGAPPPDVDTEAAYRRAVRDA